MQSVKTAARCLTVLFISLLLIQCSGADRPRVVSLENPAAGNSRLPYLFTDDTGTVFMSWVTEVEGPETQLHYARLQGNSWSSPFMIAEGSDWFVNWADYPKITAYDGEPAAVHWLKKIPGNTYSYIIRMALSQDERKWSDPVTPHRDGTATEHGFVSMIPWNKDEVLAIWLDGRATAGRADDEYSNLAKAMTLRSAVISRDGAIRRSRLIDSTVCDCCQTSLTRTDAGAVAAYRNRTGEEIRDIYISRYENDEWTEPHLVHKDGWKIGGCPVNGPSVAARGNRILVTWFTAADNNPKVKAAFSTDGGQTFGDPFSVGDGAPLGRVDAVLTESAGIISWMEKTGNSTAEFRIRRVGKDGALSPSRTIARMDPRRRSGFPQITHTSNGLVAAWTVLGDKPEIKTARIEF